MAMKLAGMELYGQPDAGHGALAVRVFASDMTFDATVNPIVYEGGILYSSTQNMIPGIWILRL